LATSKVRTNRPVDLETSTIKVVRRAPRATVQKKENGKKKQRAPFNADEMLAAYQMSTSVREMAEKVGASSVDTVYAYLKRKGLPLEGMGRKADDKDKGLATAESRQADEKADEKEPLAAVDPELSILIKAERRTAETSIDRRIAQIDELKAGLLQTKHTVGPFTPNERVYALEKIIRLSRELAVLYRTVGDFQEVGRWERNVETVKELLDKIRNRVQ
jgi:hypothetical protein